MKSFINLRILRCARLNRMNPASGAIIIEEGKDGFFILQNISNLCLPTNEFLPKIPNGGSRILLQVLDNLYLLL